MRSNDSLVAGLVDAELIDVLIPTPPAACRAAVVSVPCNCHAVGSGCPSTQIFAAIVVGFVPVTDSLVCSTCPGVYAVGST